MSQIIEDRLPEFPLRHPPYCGADVEEFLCRFTGRAYTNPRPPAAQKMPTVLFYPTLPSTMQMYLKQLGYKSRRHRVALDERIAWLDEQLKDGPVAIWVLPKPAAPFALHVVAVAARHELGSFVVFDDRVPKSNLPAGYTYWDEGELLAVFRTFRWFQDHAYALTFA